jgi:tRNA (guanine-N7-)-methyltransferase
VITFELLSAGKYLPADYWSGQIAGARRTEIEIGPGDGRFLVEAARRDPSAVWVGLEARANLARAIAMRADLPVNARIHHCDARFIVERLIADASVAGFHLYFPDPWWKKRHHKRRLFAGDLAGALRRCLQPECAVYVLTDVEIAYRDAADSLQAVGLRMEAWERESDDPAQSSYERKYRRQGRRLYQARFVKDRDRRLRR